MCLLAVDVLYVSNAAFVQEMVLLVAMRHADLMVAMARASSFAKKLWDNKVIPPELAILCRPNVVMGLFKW